MPEHKEVIVVGGGAVGASVLYGLTQRGCTDALLLEKGRLTSGSTWMAAGLLPSYARSRTATRIINKSIEIYRHLDQVCDDPIGLHICGQMRIARTEGRMDEYRSYMDIAEAAGTEAQLLTPEEVFEKWPLLEDRESVLGALYHPNEGHVSPTDVTMALARQAKEAGATIIENAGVQEFLRLDNGIWQLKTAQGEFTCNHVVLATGLHARHMSAKFGMDLPAHPLCVQYWITDPVPEVLDRRSGNRPEFPIVRDELFDGYTREEGQGLMFGFYERPEHLELFHPDGLNPDYENEVLPANLEAHEEFMEIALEAIPALGRAAVRSNTRGAMQMTPDGMPLVGPAWGASNVWLAEGVPGGILWGGGIGHALSAWILDGAPPFDMAELDARRFTSHATAAWSKAKARETWGLHAKPHIPGEETPAGRPARTTPIHDALTIAGAVMGANAGWEMPLWYAPEGTDPVDDVSYRRSKHGPVVSDEVSAVRSRAGLIELSQMSKFEVTGPGAERFLNRVLCCKLPEIGNARLAYQLFEEGGVAANYTVTRLAANEFYLVSIPRVERMNHDLLLRAARGEHGVQIRNVTNQRGILAVAGPHARDIVQSVVEADLDTARLPWFGATTANAGFAPDVRVLRLSMTGEPAWELHHPIEYQRHLLEALRSAGESHEMRMVGTRALSSLRIDKTYREFGMDIHREISPLRAGLHRFVDMTKEFCGRLALENEHTLGLETRLVPLELDNGIASPIEHEGVYDRTGQLVGRITSASWSWHFNKELGIALLPEPLSTPGVELEVSVLGERRNAVTIPESPYDPSNSLLKVATKGLDRGTQVEAR